MDKKSSKELFKESFIFAVSTLGEKGQVVIPVKIRKKMKMKKGQRLIVFLDRAGAVIFIPVERFEKIALLFDKKLSEIKKLANLLPKRKLFLGLGCDMLPSTRYPSKKIIKNCYPSGRYSTNHTF